MYSDLLNYSIHLVEINEESMNRVMEVTSSDKIKYDFFNDVKPYVDEIEEIANKWKSLALDWVIEVKPKYLHAMQIETTYDNLLSNAVGGFFKDTKLKRFKDTYQSINYVLNQIIEQLKIENNK